MNAFIIHFFETLKRLASGVSRLLAVVGLGVLLLFAVATLLDALLRGLVGHPIEWVRDLGGVVVAGALSCCFPLGFLEQHNVTIRAIDLHVGLKARQLLSIFAAGVVELVVISIAWQFWSYASKMGKSSETSVMLDVPLAPFWYVVDMIFWVAAFVQFVVLVFEVLPIFDDRMGLPARDAGEGHLGFGQTNE